MKLVYIQIAIAIICQLTFLIVLTRNLVKRKSIFGWLFPQGTTKKEKILLIGSIVVLIIDMVISHQNKRRFKKT